ncbi:MAG: polysaccharide pyruvyl transferase family protein, partial [Candidatus Hodarchaeota archaeon]
MQNHPMTLLKQEFNQLVNIIPKNSKIAYLEYPIHTNIGDILIMKGTERFFAENKINVICRHSLLDFSPKITFPLDTILVFQGGGNLGDLWYSVQKFRENCIKRYTQHRIIILPQTVYFENSNNLENTSKI